MLSRQATVWKGVRQVLDDFGGGNARSSRSMLGVALGADSLKTEVIVDDSLWRQSRSFMLTVLFGPRQAKSPVMLA